MIETHYPDHAIIGEEYGATRKESPYCWVIDPIDGTKSFMIGRAIFGTLISLNYNNVPVLGVIDQPITQERWMGLQGRGATLNGKRIATRDCAYLNEAILCTTARELFNKEDGAAYDKVSEAVKYTIYGGDCYNYALLAMGMVDVVIESGLKPHDFCALVTVVTEAGGVCTDWEGRPINYYSNGKIIASGNKLLHEKLLKLLA
jgi:histidinol phosphatase-like enzyme (inositol monophosphatase family)